MVYLQQNLDFLLSEKRNKSAALRFFRKAIGLQGLPEKVTLDKIGTNQSALDSINLYLALCFSLYGKVFYQIGIRQISYLNNMIEQDHRHIKRITKPMLGFKAFHSAKATIAGIELHRMLRKGQPIEAANMSVFEPFYALAA
jgi:putative transposase